MTTTIPTAIITTTTTMTATTATMNAGASLDEPRLVYSSDSDINDDEPSELTTYSFSDDDDDNVDEQQQQEEEQQQEEQQQQQPSPIRRSVSTALTTSPTRETFAILGLVNAEGQQSPITPTQQVLLDQQLQDQQLFAKQVNNNDNGLILERQQHELPPPPGLEGSGGNDLTAVQQLTEQRQPFTFNYRPESRHESSPAAENPVVRQNSETRGTIKLFEHTGVLPQDERPPPNDYGMGITDLLTAPAKPIFTFDYHADTDTDTPMIRIGQQQPTEGRFADSTNTSSSSLMMIQQDELPPPFGLERLGETEDYLRPFDYESQLSTGPNGRSHEQQKVLPKPLFAFDLDDSGRSLAATMMEDDGSCTHSADDHVRTKKQSYCCTYRILFVVFLLLTVGTTVFCIVQGNGTSVTASEQGAAGTASQTAPTASPTVSNNTNNNSGGAPSGSPLSNNIFATPTIHDTLKPSITVPLTSAPTTTVPLTTTTLPPTTLAPTTLPPTTLPPTTTTPTLPPTIKPTTPGDLLDTTCGMQTPGVLIIDGGGLIRGRGSPAIEAMLDELAANNGNSGDKHSSLVVIPTAGARLDSDEIAEFKAEWVDNVGFDGDADHFTVLHPERIQSDHTGVEDAAEADTETFVAPLRTADAIFMTGGRQWRLVDAYKYTRTHEELWNVLERGGVIAGTSAGATSQGFVMPRADPRGSGIELASREWYQYGFGFVRGVAFDVHVDARDRWDGLYDVLAVHPDVLGIGIAELTSIVIKGKYFQVIGGADSKVAVYQCADARSCNERDSPYQVLVPGQWFDLCSRTVVDDEPTAEERTVTKIRPMALPYAFEDDYRAAGRRFLCSGRFCHWTSSVIDVNDATEVILSARLESAGDLEDDDFVRLSYQATNANEAWGDWMEVEVRTGRFVAADIATGAMLGEGKHLRIRIESQTTHEGSEMYIVDNLRVVTM